MIALTTYLWKEWRDQRMTVFGILIVQLLASLFFALFVRDTVVGSTGMVSAITLGSLVLTLVAFGPELIAGEARSGTLGLLSRMPSGLHLAFWAKVLFMLGALLALFWSGYLLSCGFHLMVRESWETLGPRLVDDWIVPGAVTIGFLLMAVSCWLPRSILTIPTTALLILALLLPCFFIWSRDLQLASYLDIESGIYFGPPLALGVLWLSFARGRRAGGGPGSSAWRGLLACVAVSIPLWSWVGYWMHEWTTPRPHDQMEILNGLMGTDGRLAFLNTRRRYDWPSISLVVDLETGEWHRLGKPNEMVAPIGWNEPVLAPR